MGTLAAGAQPLECAQTTRLTAAHPVAGDAFGSSLAVRGDVAVVGAVYTDCAAGTNCGAAYVFQFDGLNWVPRQKLTASDASAVALLGSAAATDGSVIVMGAGGDDCSAGADCGSAYVFRLEGAEWVEEQKLVAADAAAGANFGRAVAVSGDFLAVGAMWDDCPAAVDCGSAYVFEYTGSGWVERQKLTAADAAADAWFGRSVSLDQDVLVVGAALDACDAGTHCGSAYVFRRTGDAWTQEQKLTASDPSRALFGFSLSSTPTTVLVGAMLDNCADGSYCGAAYVYRLDGSSWVQQQKLTPADAAADALFGSAVSLSGETALIGARTDDCEDGMNCGSAYVFRFDGSGWVEQQKLAASDAAATDWFGWSVGLSDDVALVGAWRDDCADGPECGSAYVFTCVCAMEADVEDDCDVDLFDYAAFACCAGALDDPQCDPGDELCAGADLDGDGDVDFADFRRFQLLYRAP